MKREIVNIVISYGSEDEVIEYAKELKKQTICVPLVVVINKIGKKGIPYLKQKLSDLTIEYELYNPKENLGYLNGLLFGYKSTKLKSEWYVLSNTDIIIEDRFFFEKFLQSSASKCEKYWLIGPSVYSSNKNTYSNPYLLKRPNKTFYISRIIAMRFTNIFSFYHDLKNKITEKRRGKKTESGDVYAIHGSYMFLRMDLLNILLMRQAWELLFGEEQYIAELVLENKHKVFFDSDIEVQHMEGTSTGRIDLKNRYNLMIKANARILQEFYCRRGERRT